MGFAGAACYLDYRELTMQDYEWFFEKLRQAGIKLIFDIGIASPPELRFFGLFDRIFLPLIREDLNSFEYQRFKKQIENMEYGHRRAGKKQCLKVGRISGEGSSGLERITEAKSDGKT